VIDVVDIAMLGPSGAGKTSLLVSMYAQFATVARSTGLALTAQDSKTIELSRYRAQLEELGRQLVVREPGISGTRSLRQHTFRLRKPSEDADQHVDLRFTDYPGGWLMDAERSDSAELTTKLGASDIMLLAVDTPALLAEDGRWHYSINTPWRIRDVVADWVTTRERLLVIAPLKCERWACDESAANTLARTVQSAYSDVIDTALQAGNGTRVVITPVQTVGSVIFDGYEVIDDVPTSHFRGREPHPRYDPKWTGEPLRQVMADVIRRQQDSRHLFRRVAEGVFGWGKEFRDALDRLTHERLGPHIELR
jgi:hypothetical protein